MNVITIFALYCILTVFIVTGIIIFYFNFASILHFRWYIDYFKMKENICKNNHHSKLEIETVRYNLYRFLNSINKNEETYENIKEKYSSSFYFLLCFFLILIIALYFIYGIFIPLIIYLFLYCLFGILNSYIIKNFSKIDDILKDPESDFHKYGNLYKILNYLITLNQMDNDSIIFNEEKFNIVPLTFKQILEKNIFAYENSSNTSKIKLIKQDMYEQLDFLKFLVLENISPFYLKFFDDIYITYYDSILNTRQKIYLSVLDKNVTYNDVKKGFNNIKDLVSLEENKQTTLASDLNKAISDLYVSNPFANSLEYNETNHQSILRSWTKMYNLYSKSQDVNSNKSDFYIKVQIQLLDIKYNLDLCESKKIFQDLNKKIHERLNFKDIPDNDYLLYLYKNKDILFTTNSNFDDILDAVNNQGTYVYAYIFFISIFFVLFSHAVFVLFNNEYYFFILVAIFIIFLFIGKIVSSQFSSA